MKSKEVFTDTFTKGNKSYFFDICKSVQGYYYLRISESRRTNSGFNHFRVMIFEEDLSAFSDAFKKSISKFKEYKNKKIATTK